MMTTVLDTPDGPLRIARIASALLGALSAPCISFR
jgi:hypothetical protein